jgi:hypothetical protein
VRAPGEVAVLVAAGAREVELARLERGDAALLHGRWTLSGWADGWSSAAARCLRGGACASRVGGRVVVTLRLHRNMAMRSLSSGLTGVAQVRAGLQSRAWTCVQTCVRLSRATCGLACGPARAACGPACGFARPILRPPPPSAPFGSTLSRMENLEGGTKPAEISERRSKLSRRNLKRD